MAQDESVQCDICRKTCKSKRGLNRHKTIKHKSGDKDSATSTTPPLRLHPLQFKDFVRKCASKLSADECYPKDIQEEFKAFIFTALDSQYSFKFLERTVQNFNRDAEKFYPDIYSCFTQNVVFRHLSKNASLVLGLEVANHVLAHLSSSSSFEDPAHLETNTGNFSEKEIAIVTYLSGYVFGTLYRRIRSSNKWNTENNQQCLAILRAGKSEDGDQQMQKSDVLINAKNRGGLWQVVPEIKKIFLIAESKFRLYTAHRISKIDSNYLVSQLLLNSSVQGNYLDVCSRADIEKVPKEIALNLLEHLLLLYIRVRSFSFAKDKLKKHKFEIQQRKTKSLRTELKRKANVNTSALDL